MLICLPEFGFNPINFYTIELPFFIGQEMWWDLGIELSRIMANINEDGLLP